MSSFTFVNVFSATTFAASAPSFNTFVRYEPSDSAMISLYLQMISEENQTFMSISLERCSSYKIWSPLLNRIEMSNDCLC